MSDRWRSGTLVAQLRIAADGVPGPTIEVREGETLTFGRDPLVEVQLNDPSASRAHFKIKGHRGAPYIKDLNSTNGTLVNGTRVGEARLRIGDEIRVGSTSLVVNSVSASEEDAATLEDTADITAAVAAEAAPSPTSEETPAAPAAATSPSGSRPGGRPDPLIGRTLGGYVILALQGKGGMGRVYRATQISLNRTVALKILSTRLTKDETFVRQFFQEARAAGQLNHPNVVQVYDVGTDPTLGLSFYSMEFIQGGSIQQMISGEEKALPVKIAMPYMLDATRGLVYAEKKQIVHRDIKPDNLMLSDNGLVKIADLGLAKSLNEGEKGKESVIGTPHFISPEQARGQAVDTRSDLYSLGATFYRILTGRTPFSGRTVKEIVQQQISTLPTPLREIDPEIPDDVAAIIEKLLEKDPASRYQSAEELVEVLEDVIRAHHYGRGGRKGLWIGIGVAAVALITAAIVIINRPPPEKEVITEIVQDEAAQAAVKEQEERNRQQAAQLALDSARLFENRTGREEATAARYEEVAAEHEGTEAAAAAVETAATIRKEIADRLALEKKSRAEQLAKYQRIETAVTDALGKGDLVTAHTALRTDPNREALMAIEEYRPQLEALSTRIHDDVARQADQTIASVKISLDGHRFDEAQATVAKGLAALSAPGLSEAEQPFAADLERLRGWTDKITDARTAEQERIRNADRDRYYATLTEATGLVDSFDFAGALNRIASVESKLATEEYRAEARRWIERIGRAHELKSQALAALDSGLRSGQRPVLPLPTAISGTSRAALSDINGDELGFEIAAPGGRGTINHTFAITEYSAAGLVDLLETALPGDAPGSAVSMADLLVLLSGFAEAEQILARVTEIESPEVKQCSEWLAREREATRLVREARTLFEAAQRHERIIEIFETLRRTFPDTLAFLRSSDGTSHYVARTPPAAEGAADDTATGSDDRAATTNGGR